jgi:tRNA U38,U39,U40 pseudouridine synthase TruA
VLTAGGRAPLAPDHVEPLLEARQRALYGQAALAKGLTLERIEFHESGESRRT